jgi:O-antigen/teichoic acid export membrane protein
MPDTHADTDSGLSPRQPDEDSRRAGEADFADQVQSAIPEEEAMSQVSLPRATYVLHYARGVALKAGRKGFWALADQAVVSLGNFAMIVAVARSVSKDDYGTFGISLDAMFFLISLHAGLITYPLTVRGAVSDDESLRRLATASLILTVLFALPIALGGLVVGGATSHVALAAIGAATLLCWQLQETLRRGLMSHLRHRHAIWGDAISYLGFGTGAWILKSAGLLSLPTAFAAMAVCYAGGTLVQASQIGLAKVDRSFAKQTLRDFWKAGRWVLLTNLSTVALSLCGVWAIAYFHGRAETGEFYAMGNFLKLTNPLMISVAGLIVPVAARAVADRGAEAALRTSMKYAALGLAMLAPYYVLLLAFPSLMIRLAYGRGSHFLGAEAVLRWFAVGSLVLYITVIATAYLNGIHRPHQTFIAQIVGSIAMIAIMLPLTIAYGAIGQVIGGPIACILQISVLASFIWKSRHTRPGTATIE